MASIGVGSRRESPREELYGAVLRREWEKVVEMYRKHPERQSMKITKSEDTALHVAITQGAAEEEIQKLVDEINTTTDETAKKKTLLAKNKRGDTALHCAASRGSLRICERIVPRNAATEFVKALVCNRNSEGETPLFLAALNAHKHVFLYLHSLCTSRDQMDSSPWRKQGGDTILHSTIQRQHFDLSLIIIHKYKAHNIAGLRNEQGTTPLQILASIPSAFRSGTSLSGWDRLCYKYMQVPRLEFDANDHPVNIDSEAHQTQCFKDDGSAESRVSLIRKLKEKHVWGAQLTEELLKQNSEYDYNDNEISLFQDLSDEMQLQELVVGRGESDDTKETKKDVDENIQNQIMNNMKEQIQNTDVDPVLKCILAAQMSLVSSFKHFGHTKEDKPSALLIATKHGLIELVQKILEIRGVAIHDKTPAKKRNIVLVAAENRQPHIIQLLINQENSKSLWPSLRQEVDDDGNNALHLAAMLPQQLPWEIHGSAMQMQWEVKWFEYMKQKMPPYLNSQVNKEGKTAEEIFAENHKSLVKEGNKWLKDTSASYSIVAALTAGVTYSTSYSVPGGTDDFGKPILQGKPAFEIFSITALLSFCFSVTSLAAFLAVYSSRMQSKDFHLNLPWKLCLGLTSFFVSVVTMLISFCAAHSFELDRGNKYQYYYKVNPWYSITLLPLCFYAAVQIPLYWDLIRASFTKVPRPKHVGGYVPI